MSSQPSSQFTMNPESNVHVFTTLLAIHNESEVFRIVVGPLNFSGSEASIDLPCPAVFDIAHVVVGNTIVISIRNTKISVFHRRFDQNLNLFVPGVINEDAHWRFVELAQGVVTETR